MLNSAEILQRLRQEGYRITGPRRAIIESLDQWEGRFSAAELEEMVVRAVPVAGRATVFRTLELLRNLGLLERVHAAGAQRDGYVVAAGAHHHHLVCSRCGRVEEILGCVVEEMVERLAEQAGFRVEGHWLEIAGVCQRCQRLVAREEEN